MKNDIGFVILNLEENTLHHSILYTIRQIIDSNPYKNICIFNHECSKIDIMNIPLLHLKQAKFFNGDLFVFDTISLMLAEQFPNINNTYYYAATIPWQNKTYEYTGWRRMFLQDRLNIICQNQKIYDIYNICWREPIGIAEKFTYEQIHKLIQ